MSRMKKSGRKIISAISVLAVSVLLSISTYAGSTVGASSADGASGVEYTVVVEDAKGQVIEYVNEPFVQNGTIYLPLRETFDRLGYTENDSYLRWDNGMIDAAILAYPMNNGFFRMKVGDSVLHFSISRDTSLDGERIDALLDRAEDFGIVFQNAPEVLLRNSTSYVPVDMMDYIFYGFFGKKQEDNSLCSFACTVYNETGNEVTLE